MDKKQQVFIIHARPLVINNKSGAVAVRQWGARRGATFAIKKGTWGSFYVSTALCGKKDNFNRKIGRTIAMSRIDLPEKRLRVKGLSSALEVVREVCVTNNYLVPVKSIEYLVDTFNGKDNRR